MYVYTVTFGYKDHSILRLFLLLLILNTF